MASTGHKSTFPTDTELFSSSEDFTDPLPLTIYSFWSIGLQIFFVESISSFINESFCRDTESDLNFPIESSTSTIRSKGSVGPPSPFDSASPSSPFVVNLSSAECTVGKLEFESWNCEFVASLTEELSMPTEGIVGAWQNA